MEKTENKRRKKFLGTPFEKKLLFFFFLAFFLPSLITGVCLYYLIFNLIIYQVGMPEVVVDNLSPVIRKVNLIITIALPFALLVMWLLARELSHRVSGPLNRLCRELDEMIAGKKKYHIKLRKKDELRGLVERFNILLNNSTREEK